MASRKPKTVSRRVYFFRADAGVDNNGRPIAFDARGALAALDAVGFSNGDRYWEHEEGAVTCGWVDALEPIPHMRLAVVRRESLPQVENRGALSDLEIARSAGLAEQSHIAFFPGNVVGSEFNFYGPRLTRLGPYLEKVIPAEVSDVRFAPLVRGDAWDEVAQLGEIRLMRMRIRPSYASRVREANETLGQAFSAAAAYGSAEDVEITLRAAPYRRESHLAARVRETLNRFRKSDGLGGADSPVVLQVGGIDSRTGCMTTIDVLSDKLVSMQQITTLNSRTRVLNSESAYSAIHKAYAVLKNDLDAAAAVL